jgi:acyl-coenzyme A synthetase/AMP-(fatty) acid ligase
MATDLRNQDTELCPQLVDHLARERPNTAYGLWPVASDSYDAGFHTITYGQLSNIVNGLAWWIVKQLGKGQGIQQEVLTYIGPNDVRLTAMILASVKTGYVVCDRPSTPSSRQRDYC